MRVLQVPDGKDPDDFLRRIAGGMGQRWSMARRA